MKKGVSQKKERSVGILIPILCVIMVFCAAGLLSCYAKEKMKGIKYEISDEIESALPGDSDSIADFKFTVELPDGKNRRYALVIHDVKFVGGDLTFADMNEGQWEYSIEGGMWLPLILTKGECLLSADLPAGKRLLLIRATSDLDIEAAGGSLNFKLKLKENPGAVISRILLGIAAGGLLVSVIYLTAKSRVNKKPE